jgi:hypothetical protein
MKHFIFTVFVFNFSLFGFSFDVGEMWDSTVDIVKDTVHETGILSNSSDYTLKNISEDEVRVAFKKSLTDAFNYSKETLSQKNSFYEHEETLIDYPVKLKIVTSALNQFDGSKYFNGKKIVENFQKSLNQTAENVVAKVEPIFAKNINEASFNNVKSFLFEEENGITNGFETKQRSEIFDLIRPIVSAEMKYQNTEKSFFTLQDIYKKIMVGIQDFDAVSTVLSVAGYNQNSLKYQDLENDLTEKILDSIFFHMSIYENKLRKNKQFRSTENLQKVFNLQD